MEKQNSHYLDETIKRCKKKLKEIEKIHGKYSERWHIANENLLNHQYFKDNGIPRNVEQSVEIPYDTINEF